MGVRGSCIFFAYKLWEEDLTMANGNAIIIVSSARQEHSAVFSALLRMLGWRILQGFQSLFHFLKKRCFHRLLREYPTDSLL